MTRAEVLAWLDARRPAAPAALKDRIAHAVTDSELALPEHLAVLGRQLLSGVASDPAGGRELALDLLAADAFVTYAFEAQAESGLAGLARLAEDQAQ